MVDIFAIGLTHALIALAVWRLMLRDDLDTEVPPELPEAPKRRGARR